MLKLNFVYLIFLFKILFVCAQTKDEIAYRCSVRITCEDCLNFHKECAWCSKWDLNNNPKCNIKENLLLSGCDDEHIEIFQQSKIDILKDNDFHEFETNINETVQMKPQHLHIKLRPGQMESFEIKIKLVKNYPMDMYLLLDVSDTIREQKQTISKLSALLTDALKKLTKHYRVGFGTFADKPLMPMINTNSKNNTCPHQEEICILPYSFKHNMSMTDNVDKFMKAINKTRIASNLDNLDSGFDALMQVVVCHDIIGWNKNSRKIIILATNSLLHLAGDGLLAGIIKPNDGKCYLDKDGNYLESLNQDYPSVNQIMNKLEENKMNTVFAVDKMNMEYYKELVNIMPSFTHVTTLESDASNIIEIVTQSYKKISSKIKLRDNATYPIQLKYSSSCGQKRKKYVDSCKNVTIGNEYTFVIELQYFNCPKKQSDLVQRIQIDEANLGFESIIVDVELICKCNCTKNTTEQSDNCNSNGNEICGQCYCDTEWGGKTCECDMTSNKNTNVLPCLNNKTNSFCSERGECRCGKCDCEIGYMGEFCECDECPRKNNIMCNNQGTCECGICECYENWSGENCECSSNNKDCIAENEQHICSGNGKCDCGKCICNYDDNHRFSGDYCEINLDETCKTYEKCVSCLYEKSENECMETDCNFNEVEYTDFTKRELTEEERHTACFYQSSENGMTCRHYFIFTKKNHEISFNFNSKTCQIETYAGSFTIFGSIVLILLLAYGFTILLIKYRNIQKEKKEFEEFNRNVEMIKKETQSGNNVNPLYKSPITKFELHSIIKKDK